MLRFVIGAMALAVLASASGCEPAKLRSGEGIYCSTKDEDPLHECDRGRDLVCIATFSVPVQDPDLARKFENGLRPVYVCRLACDEANECRDPGAVCCRGKVYGRTYDKRGACTPRADCESYTPPDAEVVDAYEEPADAGADAPPDAGAEADGPTIGDDADAGAAP